MDERRGRYGWVGVAIATVAAGLVLERLIRAMTDALDRSSRLAQDTVSQSTRAVEQLVTALTVQVAPDVVVAQADERQGDLIDDAQDARDEGIDWLDQWVPGGHLVTGDGLTTAPDLAGEL